MSEGKIEDQVKRAELKLAGLIAVNNLTFSVMDTLSPLIKDICPDSKIAGKLASRRTKTTHIVKQILGRSFLELLYEKVFLSRFFFLSNKG